MSLKWIAQRLEWAPGRTFSIAWYKSANRIRKLEWEVAKVEPATLIQ
jgi:hypothetical protein